MHHVPTAQFATELALVSSLKPNPLNPRTHNRHQLRKLRRSIRKLGFLGAILVDRTDTIIAGHARWMAAQDLGMTLIPVIRLENLSDAQLRAYLIADNRLAEDAGWDANLLLSSFQELLSIEDSSFDITLSAFEMAEIDLILSEPKSQPPEESLDIPQDLPRVSQSGDLWQLQKHRLYCGSALDPASFETLLHKKKATVVITDPPYNVPIDGNATGKGSIHHREFAMASGEMSEYEFTSFLRTCLNLLAKNSLDGSVHYIFIDWRHLGELLATGRQVYDELLNLCVWVKHNGGMGSFYRSQHELVFVFRNGKGKNQNNIQLGKFGRNRTNVWEYPGVNTFSKQGDEGNLLALHPTVKPVALVADAILDCSSRGDIVLDCFLGSGTTLMAAERTGRVCYGIEIDSQYVDTAIRRWQKHTGGDAIHVPSGKTFNEMEAERKESNVQHG